MVREDMKKLGFGLMRLPRLDVHDEKSIDYVKTKVLIDKFMQAGFSYFDTAMAYQGGEGERAFGKLVALRYPRESFFITTKLPSWHFHGDDDLNAAFEAELERLQVKEVDCYYLHALADHNMTWPMKRDDFGFLKKLKSEGKARNIGFSFHGTPELLDRLLTEHPEVDMVQLQLNYVDWEASNVQSRACYEVAVKHGKTITVMEPLKGGTLVNLPKDAENLLKAYAPQTSSASWGLRFAASLPNVMVVLSGMNDLSQVIDNVETFQRFSPLTGEENKLLEQVCEIIHSDIYVPCTGCRYCKAGCPKNIAIPEYFQLFNDYKRAHEVYLPIHWNIYHSLVFNYGKANECIACGQCENKCPQHLPIIQYLKEFSTALDGRTGHD